MSQRPAGQLFEVASHLTVSNRFTEGTVSVLRPAVLCIILLIGVNFDSVSRYKVSDV